MDSKSLCVLYCHRVDVFQKPVGHLRARFELLTTLLMKIEVLCDNNVMFNGLLFGMSS